MKGDTYILAADHFSATNKKHQYGKWGDKVTEISQSDNTLIVQGKREAFSINIHKLIKK